MEIDREILVESFKGLSDEIKKIQTKDSYWKEEKKILEKMIKKREEIKKSIEMTDSKYKQRFNL